MKPGRHRLMRALARKCSLIQGMGSFSEGRQVLGTRKTRKRLTCRKIRQGNSYRWWFPLIKKVTMARLRLKFLFTGKSVSRQTNGKGSTRRCHKIPKSSECESVKILDSNCSGWEI